MVNAQAGQSKSRVAILRLNDIPRDPRVRRTAKLLLERGHEVQVYSIRPANSSEEEYLDGFKIIRLSADICTFNSEEFERSFDPKIYSVAKSIWPDIFYSPESNLPPNSVEPEPAISTPEIHTQLPSPPPSMQVSRKRKLFSLAKKIVPESIRVSLKNYYLSQISLLYGNLTPAQINPPPPPKLALVDRDRDETRWRLQLNMDMTQKIGNWATHVYCCDLDTLFAGVMLKRAYGVKLIYDAYEIWAHQWADDFRSSQFLGFYSTLERLMLPYTDGRVTVGCGLAEYFEHTYASKPFIIAPSTPNINFLTPEKIIERNNPRKGILYHGAYAPFRGLEEIIDVIPLLDDCRVAFRGVGDYEKELRQLVVKKGLEDRVEFLPPVRVDELVSSASEFDIGLLPFVNSCLNTNYAYPNKLFEYMMAGMALASSDLVDQRRLIEKHQMGVVFNINDKFEVAEQLNFLLRNPDKLNKMRRNAWTAAKEQYNWETACQELVRLLIDCGL